MAFSLAQELLITARVRTSTGDPSPMTPALGAKEDQKTPPPPPAPAATPLTPGK